MLPSHLLEIIVATALWPCGVRHRDNAHHHGDDLVCYRVLSHCSKTLNEVVKSLPAGRQAAFELWWRSTLASDTGYMVWNEKRYNNAVAASVLTVGQPLLIEVEDKTIDGIVVETDSRYDYSWTTALGVDSPRGTTALGVEKAIPERVKVEFVIDESGHRIQVWFPVRTDGIINPTVSVDWGRIQYKAMHRQNAEIRLGWPYQGRRVPKVSEPFEEDKGNERGEPPSLWVLLPLVLMPWALVVVGKEDGRQQLPSGWARLLCRLLCGGLRRVAGAAVEDPATLLMASGVGVGWAWFVAHWVDAFWYSSSRRVKGSTSYHKGKLRPEDKQWRLLLATALALGAALLWQNG